MLAFSPIIIAGLIEDLTHKVKPRTRLLLASISALATLIVTQAYIVRTDIVLIDALLKIPGLSLILTVLVIVGFLNSINIIDGFNGVASGSSLIMAVTICVIAYIVEDFLVIRLSVLISVPIIGFMLWNWPFGKIFLGDCGAYLIGIWIVVLGILLQFRSSNISPLAPVLIGAYPMIETLFTIYRRKFLRGRPVSRPDALHLHTLIYRRLIRKSELMANSRKVIISNSKVAVYIWLFIITDCMLSVLFFENTNALLFFILLNIIIYIRIYSIIIKFKTPKIMLC
jgi:UDP-N-acetylmuramyl pentapeptide phosphotransferase/UDP-N-acetylglucosamine-1-phosphate transferase